MVVATKNNIEKLPDSIEYLKSIGFKKFNILFDYLADWQDEDLEVIRKSFSEVAEIYYKELLNENDLDFPLFDEKIRTHIKEDFNCNGICRIDRTTGAAACRHVLRFNLQQWFGLCRIGQRV